MCSIYEVKKGTKKDLLEIKTLLNDHLSFGLMTKELVRKMVQREEVFCLMRKETIIGVCTIKKIENIEAFLFHKKEAKKLVENYFPKEGDLYTVGHLVLGPTYRSTMAAFRFVQQLSKELEDQNFLLLGWKKPTGWDAESLALKFSFERLGEIERFWFEDSIEKGYGCPYCEKGCACSALLAARKSAKNQ